MKLNKPQGTITVPLNVTATPFVAFGIVDYLNRATHDGMSGMYVSSDGFTDTAITFYPDWSSSNIINGLMWVCVSKV